MVGVEARVETPTFIMIDKFINVFEGLERAYGQFKKNDKKLSVKVEGRPWIEHKQVTKQLWENHLNLHRTLQKIYQTILQYLSRYGMNVFRVKAVSKL